MLDANYFFYQIRKTVLDFFNFKLSITMIWSYGWKYPVWEGRKNLSRQNLNCNIYVILHKEFTNFYSRWLV